jgi:myo-inositol-1(or 4)-monophosphatase
MDLNRVGEQVIQLTYKIAEYISKERKSFSISKVESKGLHDLVSYVDKQSEKQLVDGLRKIIPNSGFITEEKTANNNNEDYIWIIDPLDGTTNFIHNLYPYAISIALQYKQETILGVVYELGADEMFYSWKGISAFCNKKEINVTSTKTMNDGLIATGFSINDFDRLEKHLKVAADVIKKSHGLHRHGSAATDLVYVAAGRFDGFFEYGLSVWDVAAGVFILQQANGVVSDYLGKNNYLYGREIVVGTKQVHKELLDILKKHM